MPYTWVDDDGPTFINSNTNYNGQPQSQPQRYRARHQSDAYGQQGVYIDDRQYRHVRANSAAQPQPTQIIIENQNFIDDHPQQQQQAPPPPQIQYYGRPRSIHEHRVVYHDQEIIRIKEKEKNKSRSRSRSRSRDRKRDKYKDDISYKTRRDIEELQRIQHEREEEALVERVKKDMAVKAAEEKKKEAEREAREKELKEKAIAEWQEKEAKKKREEEEKEKERERIGKEYMRQQLRKDGYTEEEIDDMMEKREKKKKKRASSPAISSTSIVIANRPTYMRVDKKHIDPRTLEEYGIEWEWADDGLIIIRRTLTSEEQEVLFEHTRKLKEKKLIEFAQVETVQIKNVQKDRHGRLLMVRKKEEKRERSKSPAVVKRFFV